MISNGAFNTLKSHIESLNFDLRVSRFSRFMDQKVTPDVLNFISDCIENLPLSEDSEFTSKDIWESSYFLTHVPAIFWKPSPQNISASNEYDKFISQPLRTLDYAKILTSERRWTTLFYKISKPQLLQYIAMRERNAYVFLYLYINKVLSDSWLANYFEVFKDKCLANEVTTDDLVELKTKYQRFILANTPINWLIEINRIFPKVLNVYAANNSINGTARGRITPDIINFRDKTKLKWTTRKEANSLIIQDVAYDKYSVDRAMSIIRRLYKDSEIKDQYSQWTADHVHHIFPRSENPNLSNYLENLIKLTATQHLSKAHPSWNTQVISKDYQQVCLIAKSKSIEDSLKKGEDYYHVEDFVFVLNTWLKWTYFSINMNFIDIRAQINYVYDSSI